MKLHELHELIALVCPIDGINSNGAIFHQAQASPEQCAAAQLVMDANLPSLDTGPP